MSTEDEIRRLNEAVRLFRDDVESGLLARGWAVTDLAVGDETPLEFFWPPTAPIGYGELPEPMDEAMRRRPSMYGTRTTPWTRPTRITQAVDGWVVEYGEAPGLQPDRPVHVTDGSALLADLERIECWPMSVPEAKQLRMERVYATTVADAHDDHSFGFFPTEPYVSRLRDLRGHLEADRASRLGLEADGAPCTSRPRGDLSARRRLIDAEAWASHVRSSRLGGSDPASP